MKVRILKRAQADLLGIRDWLEAESPASARRILDRLLDGLDQLEAQPLSGPGVRDRSLAARGYRCLVRERYLIFYRLKGAQIRVYRVLHGRTEWRRLL